jgi:hypothetical protein
MDDKETKISLEKGKMDHMGDIGLFSMPLQSNSFVKIQFE